MDEFRNSVIFKVYGRYALFSDPVTRAGGEKHSLVVPTYQALKGILESVYWKPSLIWRIDRMRVMKPIRTRSKGIRPIVMSGGNDLSVYTYLEDVEYRVQAHFIWNEHRPELSADRNEHKHHNIAKRMITKGGRRDIFLGTRECQGYVEPCEFEGDEGYYDEMKEELPLGLMFHGFSYPDETGGPALKARFWYPAMRKGIVEFIPPEECAIVREIKDYAAKRFIPGENFSPCDALFAEEGCT